MQPHQLSTTRPSRQAMPTGSRRASSAQPSGLPPHLCIALTTASGQPLLPCHFCPMQAQGLGHLAEAMEGTFPPKFQRMTEELCEVSVT